MHQPLPVTLSWDDVRQAAHAGVDRNVNAHRDSRRSAFYPQSDPELWKAHITGMIGEMVATRLLEADFHPEVNKPDTLTGDVGLLQVRFSNPAHLYLTVYPKDPEDDVYALVTGQLTRNGHPPTYHVHGYARGHEVLALGHPAEHGTRLHASQLHDPEDLVRYAYRLRPRG